MNDRVIDFFVVYATIYDKKKTRFSLYNEQKNLLSQD